MVDLVTGEVELPSGGGVDWKAATRRRAISARTRRLMRLRTHWGSQPTRRLTAAGRPPQFVLRIGRATQIESHSESH